MAARNCRRGEKFRLSARPWAFPISPMVETASAARAPREPTALRLHGAAAMIILAAFAAYWNSLRVPFFFDDPTAITNNPTIRHLSDLGTVLSPPRNGSGV